MNRKGWLVGGIGFNDAKFSLDTCSAKIKIKGKQIMPIKIYVKSLLSNFKFKKA